MKFEKEKEISINCFLYNLFLENKEKLSKELKLIDVDLDKIYIKTDVKNKRLVFTILDKKNDVAMTDCSNCCTTYTPNVKSVGGCNKFTLFVNFGCMDTDLDVVLESNNDRGLLSFTDMEIITNTMNVLYKVFSQFDKEKLNKLQELEN